MKLADQVRDHLAQGPGSAGRGRYDIFCCRAGAAGVRVTAIEDALVVGVGVDRTHHAGVDSEALVQDFHHRGQRVRRAGGGGNDLMLGRVVVTLVHTGHQRDIPPLARRRHQHALCPGLQVRSRLIGHGKGPGGLDHQLHSELAPGNIQRVEMRNNRDGAPLNDDAMILGLSRDPRKVRR